MAGILEFTTVGAPSAVAAAIEEQARTQGNVTALVVPWESSATTLNMAVTAVKSDGWAIEHTNLGTITLTAEGENATRVAVVADPPDHAERARLAAVFDRFARQLQTHLAGTDSVS